MDKMAMTRKGLKFLLAGLIVMIAGFVLLTGGGSSDPAVFNWSMFDFRRLVAAPIVIFPGIAIAGPLPFPASTQQTQLQFVP